MGQLDYALIGNCQSSALIDRHGSVVWACLPRFDSEAVFAALLDDEKAGSWSVHPASGDYSVQQTYLRNTNVLRTEFRLENGDAFEVLDFMPRFQIPGGYHRAPQIIRILRPIKGNPRIRVRLKPRFNFGRDEPEVGVTDSGLVYSRDRSRLYLSTDVPLTYVLDGTPFEVTGDSYFVLSHGEAFERPLRVSCEDFLRRTVGYWETWVRHARIPFEFQEAVIRSALALKLHIFEDTGAVIAATTTSIPESPDGGRTWDYRYCWLRDAYFVINVLNRLGHFEEMEKFIQFLHNIVSARPGAGLQPVYGIGGETELTERELPWLNGFGGMGPVRVGNAAYAHAQHDVYGEMVLAMAPLFFDSRLHRIDLRRAYAEVRGLVDQAVAAFEKPDSGIWEFRTEQKHYVFSKLMCWAAVDRGVRIGERMGEMADVHRWAQARQGMRSRIESSGWNEKAGYYTQAFADTHPDASNLLMAALNFHPGADEKFTRTVDAYEKVLMKEGFLFRYRNRDDFGVPRHAFTICTFWLIDALASMGRVAEARSVFERVLLRTNHVGLLSEDVDPVSGELWGNFPQAYSHVGVINSAFRLSKSWDEAF
ncbi:MAG TPA: glycoside hydrolase family 15 protein [Bdellovibrionota bacterium]|nr:glycoside hydrolase family 15 protein [Bdellovibrionota bacterium]